MRQFRDVNLDTSRHYYISASEQGKKHLYYATSIGYFECGTTYEVNRLDYENYLLILMMSGKLWYRSSSEYSLVKPGQALLLDCNVPHGYGAYEECSFVFCHFAGGQCDELCHELLSKNGNVFDIQDFSHTAGWISNLMMTLEANKVMDEYECSAFIYETLMKLMAVSQNKKKEESFGDDSLDSVLSYIRQHLSEKLTVQMLAEAAGYSVGYFSHQFTKKLGKSPYQFILQCRLEMAKKLLQSTNLSIQEIAEKTGFPNASNFSSVFRAEEKITPGEYKKLPF